MRSNFDEPQEIRPSLGNAIVIVFTSFEVDLKSFLEFKSVSRHNVEDGTVIILGGCTNGGLVNDAGQNIPTYEFFRSRGNAVHSSILDRSLPVNFLTWLLPSGKLLIQSNWNTVLLDYHTNEEIPLDSIPDALDYDHNVFKFTLLPGPDFLATVTSGS
ncbi:hypothetical protein K435DRAFT_863878 [Dendrothele bispora CBS 962.96]|uniref:Uncharacterized protein n=1 Tax=Dendrothele bispora (strain CBS 962.96) TaxID=1314807 RepID=A0A4S8LNP2_DENBC|nr:hypothetical protein K435DRAFT_863878 [Dendrothele bispora CBS 962.96]